MKKFLSICIFLISLSAVTYAQQMYRWTDSKGVIHYTELAPDETREQILNFTPEQSRAPADHSVKKIDKMQTTAAVLMEVEEKKFFDPELKQALNSKSSNVASAADPTSMTYCQIIHANLASFTALEHGDVDELLLITQTGAQTPVHQDDVQTHYKSTIDNLEQYCLQ